jgi:glutathione S-transferase
MHFATVEQARTAPGVRLVVLASVPSPWSESAKGLLVVKGIDGILVRFAASDRSVSQWTGWHNAPVLMIDGEPPRVHWSEILEAAERIGGRTSLVPSDPEERIRMFGLAHEVLGEGGLVWNRRLIVIHRGLITEGRDGFPLRIARYLAPKYGYTPQRAEAAETRVALILRKLGDLAEANRARGSEYLLGNRLTALDIYSATALWPFAPLSEDQCPGVPPLIRRAFDTSSAAVPTALLEHRERVYKQHLGLPVEF